MIVDIIGWKKSSYSGGQGGNCVEVAASTDGDHVYVRNTRDRDGALLDFTSSAWDTFVAGVRADEFER
jgi:hypothetical protein